MSRSALAILGIAIVISAGLWLSMRIAASASIDLLPARYRRRLQWWQGNGRTVQFACALVAVAAACVQVGMAVD
jgi:hypothetical protein